MPIINNATPDIRFYANGDILLRKSVTILLHIESGDAINIHEANGETFIFISQKRAPASFKCIARAKRGSYFRATCKKITDYMIKKDGRSNCAYYRVGEPVDINGTKYLPIITRKNYAAENQL